MQEELNLESDIKSKKKHRIHPGILIAIVIIIAVVIAILVTVNRPKPGRTITDTKSSIEKILESSQLSTLEYTYNGVATVTKENFDTVKYYAYYNGKIRTGIDFNQIIVEVDDEEKVVYITLPEATIQNLTVDPGSIEFIFLDEQYNTETVSSEAYAKCLEDLQTKAESEEEMLNISKDNAKGVIQALTEPFAKQVEGYEVIIR